MKNLFKKRKRKSESWAKQEYDAEKELRYSSIDVANQFGFYIREGLDQGLELQPANTTFEQMAHNMSVNAMRQLGLPDSFGISTEEAIAALEKGGSVLYADNKPYAAVVQKDKEEK